MFPVLVGKGVVLCSEIMHCPDLSQIWEDSLGRFGPHPRAITFLPLRMNESWQLFVCVCRVEIWTRADQRWRAEGAFKASLSAQVAPGYTVYVKTKLSHDRQGGDISAHLSAEQLVTRNCTAHWSAFLFLSCSSLEAFVNAFVSFGISN